MTNVAHNVVDVEDYVPEVIEFDESGDVTTELENAQTIQAVEDLPEKFKDKSIDDVVTMYSNLEKELGRKGQEIGDLRQLTDTLLQRDLESPKEVKESEPEPDFYDDPQKAIDKAIEKRLAPLNKRLASNDKDNFFVELHKSIPKYEDIVKDTKFQTWVQTSPYRMKMFGEADNYNLDAANELFSTWELTQPSTEESVEDTSKQRKAKLKDASTEVGSTGSARKKVFRRLDLINLKLNDPAKYASMEPEIRQAYTDGRVR